MEYNKLTRELLDKGYTVDNYPNYVRIDTSKLSGTDPLNNLGGGFVYKKHISDDFTYKTGCGLYVKGSKTFEMGYLIEWRHEDDNPITNCPYNNGKCEYNDERLHERGCGGRCPTCYCVCHRTDEEYVYENSVEKVRKEYEEYKERKYEEFVAAHNGRVCRNHVFWNVKEDKWEMNYYPNRCVTACYARNGFCPILNKQLDRKKGNVYYDLRESYIRQDDTFFSGEEIVTVTKGIRFFKKPVSMDICEAFVKLNSGEIYDKYHWNHESTMQMFDKTFKGEIINVRAESKPSRDLMQDLEDIKNGIDVVHASDQEQNEKAYKKKKRDQAKQKALDKIKQKIIKGGLDSLSYSESKKLEKNFTEEEIYELEELHYEKLEEDKNKPTQLDLFQIGLTN